jgi:non-heme chloroperoxidase
MTSNDGAPRQTTDVTEHEAAQVQRANASARQPVVFVHGLWLLPNSWDRWVALFEEVGYTALAPGWPDDPETVEEANANPDVFAHKGVGQIADHVEKVISGLEKKPAIVGHSFGGLLVEILAGRGLAAATVAISPAPFRGVLPLPISALKSAAPVLSNPANRHRAVPLTYDQFKFGFANAVGEAEAKELYANFAVPGSGTPIFQAAAANINPWTEAKVDTKNPARGPLLIVSAEKDNTVPPAIAKASYDKQKRNEGVTETVQVSDHGHALVIDNGWRQVADIALGFIERFAAPDASSAATTQVT